MKRLLIAVALSLSCINRPVLEVQPEGCIPTPDGTIYVVTRTSVEGDTCRGGDLLALSQTLGNTPDCAGFWDPSPDKCTYELYAECRFQDYEWGATIRIFTTLKWDKNWTHGAAEQSYVVMNVAHYKSCEGNQNIDLEMK